MLPTEQVERRIASGEIEIAPIAFMRGRTLSDAFIILDEAQNTTPAQMKMFLTRFGMRSRMVICGDPKQIDLPEPRQVRACTTRSARLEGIDKIVDRSASAPATSSATRSSAGSSRPMRARRMIAGRSRRLGGLGQSHRLARARRARRSTPRSPTAAMPRSIDRDSRGLGQVHLATTEVRALNAAWRGKDKPTNVLSFPMVEEEAIGSPAEPMLGDIVLAHGVCARRGGGRRASPIETHAAHLVVHGTLHLLGYDHETSDADAEEMEEVERRALASHRHRRPLSSDRGAILNHGRRQSRRPRGRTHASGAACAPCCSATTAKRRCATRSRKRSRAARARCRGSATSAMSSGRCSATSSISARRPPATSRCRAATSSPCRATISFEALVAAFAEAGHSRLPVYRGQPRHGRSA